MTQTSIETDADRVDGSTCAQAPAADETIDMLQGHAAFLDLMARVLYAPLSQEDIDGLRKAGLDGEGEPANEAERELAEGLRIMAKGLAASGDLRLDLNVDYTGAFYGVSQYEGKFAAPYESVFRDGKGELYGESRQEVFKQMKADALKLRDGINLPEDHISFELQYMAILERRAAEALATGDSAAAAKLMGKAATFACEHPLAWIDDLYALADKLLELGFYRGVLKATKGFVTLACEELDEAAQSLAASA